MAFIIKNGDLLASVNTGHIIHGCNAQGVMGSGFARCVRDMYPIAYNTYRLRYETKGFLSLREVISVVVSPTLVIHNAITQDRYGVDQRYVDYDALESALETAKNIAREKEHVPCTDIHFPFIGAGLGGGDKDVLLQIFRQVFAEDEIDGTLWIL